MEKVENIRLLHNEAMKIAQKAILAEDAGDKQKAFALNEEAFKMEREAAMALLGSDKEPARTIFFRSAAWLATLCKRFDDANELVRLGLSGNPPAEIANELLDLKAELLKKQIEEYLKTKKKQYYKAETLGGKMMVIKPLDDMVNELMRV